MAVGVARGRGDGRAAAGARELGVAAEAVGAGDLADQLGSGERAAPSLCDQLRRVAFNEHRELSLELADALGARGDLANELARYPHACGLLGAGQAAGRLAQPLGCIERAVRDLELRPEVVQMPAQSLLIAAASCDEILAMVD